MASYDDYNYFESELSNVKGSDIKLKIEGSGGGTRWLPLNEKQFDAVEALLIKLNAEENLKKHSEIVAAIRKAVRERLSHITVGRVIVQYRSLNHYEATALIHEDGEDRKEHFTVLWRMDRVEFQN